MTKEEIYLDLSKFSEVEQNEIISMLPIDDGNSYLIGFNYHYLHFLDSYWFVDEAECVSDKQEITYEQFKTLMNKTEIMNTYAKGQGFKNWSDILFQFQDDFNYASPEGENNAMNWIEHHINAVTDLIQEELKKKIYKDVSESVLGNIFKCDMLEDKILNTEIL